MYRFYLHVEETVKKEPVTASLIFAAGKGSRMKGYSGNKTLLPLIAHGSPYEGKRPILLHIIDNLPSGPKALVLNYRKEDLIKATASLDLDYYEQPLLDGTGGALIASREFILHREYDRLLITMGDVPFVRPSTYDRLLKALDNNHMAILGFRPADKREYGVLDIRKGRVTGIIEWKYWSEYPAHKQETLDICNSGIYASRKDEIIKYLDILKNRPHTVFKERNGKMTQVKEYFITDMVELMHGDGLRIGYVTAEDEDEVMGVDDRQSLIKAQDIFQRYA